MSSAGAESSEPREESNKRSKSAKVQKPQKSVPVSLDEPQDSTTQTLICVAQDLSQQIQEKEANQSTDRYKKRHRKESDPSIASSSAAPRNIDYKTPWEGYYEVKNFLKEHGMVCDWKFGEHNQKDQDLFKLALQHGTLTEIGEINRAIKFTEKPRQFRRLLSVEDRNFPAMKELDAFQFAALYGRIDVLEWLLSVKFPYDHDQESKSVFHCAAYGGHLDVLEWAAKKGYSPLTYSIGCHSSAQFAAMQGRIDIIEWLQKQGVAIDRPKDDGGMPAAVLSARFGKMDCLRWLKESAGVKLTSLKPNKHKYKNIVHYVAKHGDLETMKWLKSHSWLERVKIDGAKDFHGRTPIMFALKSGNLDLVKYLHGECGMRINKRKMDKQGRTLGHFAAAGGSVQVLQWLITMDAFNPAAKSKYGVTLPHLAARYGHLEALIWLQEQGSPMLEVCEGGYNDDPQNILTMATKSGNLELFRWIVTNYVSDSPLHSGKEAPSSAPDAARSNQGLSYNHAFMEHGGTILSYVAKFGTAELLDYLKYEGLDFKIKDHMGSTLAHYASLGGNTSTLQWLLDNNSIDFEEKDMAGRTPGYIVQFSHKLPAANWFRRHLPPEED